MGAGSHKAQDMSQAVSVLQKRSLITGERLYSPGEPIRNYVSPTYKVTGPFPGHKNGETFGDKGDRYKYYTKPSAIGPEKPRSLNLDSAAASGVSLLGAASLAAPAVLPFAAAAGVGYGAYKLGQSLSLW